MKSADHPAGPANGDADSYNFRPTGRRAVTPGVTVLTRTRTTSKEYRSIAPSYARARTALSLDRYRGLPDPDSKVVSFGKPVQDVHLSLKHKMLL